MIAPLCLLASLHGVQQQKLSIDLPPMTLNRLIPRLAELSGARLAASPTVAGDVVMLNAKDASLDELQRRLAEVADAEWNLVGETLYLTRSPSLVRAEEKFVHRARLAQIQRELQKFVPKAAPTDQQILERLREGARISDQMQKAWSEALTQSYMKLQTQAPTSGGLVEVLRSCDLTPVADLEPNQRVVYALQPTRMQRRLGPGAAKAFASLFAERERWARLAGSLDETQRDSAVGLFQLPDPNSKPDIQPEGKLIVVASRVDDYMERIRFQLVELREQPMELGPPLEVEIQDGSGAAAIPPTFSGKLGPQSIELSALIRGIFEHQKSAPKINDPWRERILRPEENDPLDSGSELLTQLARAKGGNLVALLTDRAITGIAGGPDNPREWLSAFLYGGELKSDGGWVSLEAADCRNSRSSRADRTALGEAVRKLATAPRINLDHKLMLAGISDGAPWLSAFWPALLNPLVAKGQWVSEQLALKVFGALSSAQRKTVLAGGALALGSLSGRLRELCYRAVFEVDGGTIDTSDIDDEAAAPGAGVREVTEMFPSGLPPTGTLSASTKQDLVFISTDPEDARGPRTLEQLAQEEYMRSRPDLFAWAAKLTSPQQFQLGSQSTITMRIGQASSGFVKLEITDVSVTDDRTYTIETMPKDLRQKYDQYMAKMTEDLKDAMPGGKDERQPPR